MKKESELFIAATMAAYIFLCLSDTPGYVSLEADPAGADFTSEQPPVTTQLMNDEVPIPAKDIRGWQFLAKGHGHKDMLQLNTTNAAIEIAPSTAHEASSYALNIETVHAEHQNTRIVCMQNTEGGRCTS